MEIWLQEQTLDRIEFIVRHPKLLVDRGRMPGCVVDFTRTRKGVLHYVFLVLDRDDISRKIIVQKIGHVLRPASAPGSP